MANICVSSVVMADLVKTNFISATSTDGANMASIIEYNYSVNMPPVVLAVKRGSFLQNSQSSSAEIASSSSTHRTPSAQAALRKVELQDRDYITVTLKHLGGDIASSRYRFQTAAGKVEKMGADFFAAEHSSGHQCMVYYGVNSNKYYWTWTLDPKSDAVQKG